MSLTVTINQVRGGAFVSSVRYASGVRYPHEFHLAVESLAAKMAEDLTVAHRVAQGQTEAPAQDPVRDPGTISSIRVVTPVPVSPPDHIEIRDGKPVIVKSDGDLRTGPQTAIVEKGGKIAELDTGGSIKVTRFGESPGGNGMPALPSAGMFTPGGQQAFTSPGLPESPAKPVIPPTRAVPPAPEAPAQSEGDSPPATV